MAREEKKKEEIEKWKLITTSWGRVSAEGRDRFLHITDPCAVNVRQLSRSPGGLNFYFSKGRKDDSIRDSDDAPPVTTPSSTPSE